MSPAFGEHRYLELSAACHTHEKSVVGIDLEDKPGDMVLDQTDAITPGPHTFLEARSGARQDRDGLLMFLKCLK
jgi:hypothetical protein